MELTHQFDVAAGIDDTWAAFLDMPRVAPCMPGAEITEVIDERNVNGTAAVKVGPVNLRFAGGAEMTEVDDVGHSAVLVAKGSDAKGRGNANADVGFSLTPAGAGTRVDVKTTLVLTGSVAQYGRAAGLIDEIANQLIGQFVECLEVELARTGAPAVADGESDAAGERPLPSAPDPPTPVKGLTLFFKALLARLRKLFERSRPGTR